MDKEGLCHACGNEMNKDELIEQQGIKNCCPYCGSNWFQYNDGSRIKEDY